LKQAQIGFWPAAALVAGNMIGSGIFLLPATLAVFGQLSLLGWLVSGTGAQLLAYTFARLSRLITTNGGPYAYTRWAFGDFSAFVVAWGYWISLWTGNAAIAIAFVANLTPFFPDLRTNSNLSLLVCLSSIWVATAINLRGVREAARFQLITTALRLLPILLLSTWGFYFFNTCVNHGA
jgi:APA family basic amino acid/polyamine antiporter